MISLFDFTRDARTLADQLERTSLRERRDLRVLERGLPELLRRMAGVTEFLGCALACDEMSERRSA